jgi:hypothetical protein
LCDPEPKGEPTRTRRPDPWRSARIRLGPLAQAGPVGGPRAGADPGRGRAVDRSFCDGFTPGTTHLSPPTVHPAWRRDDSRTRPAPPAHRDRSALLEWRATSVESEPSVMQRSPPPSELQPGGASSPFSPGERWPRERPEAKGLRGLGPGHCAGPGQACPEPILARRPEPRATAAARTPFSASLAIGRSAATTKGPDPPESGGASGSPAASSPTPASSTNSRCSQA